MYAVYAYIGVVLGVNVGIYGIHGVSGELSMCADFVYRRNQTWSVRITSWGKDVRITS